MSKTIAPRYHDTWREAQVPREEDAASLFGYYLVKHCREEAIAKIAFLPGSPEHAIAVKAVEIAIFKVMALLEGFFVLDAGSGKRLQLALHVQVVRGDDEIVEDVKVSPGVDLPIGYWGWVEDYGITPKAVA